MNEFVEVLKAVSDPTRLRIMMSLCNGELCVCRITALLNLAPSTISKHMSILKHAGLLKSRKDGKWIFYKLNLSDNTGLGLKILSLLKSSLQNDDLIKSDAVRLEEIISMTHEELC
ncbi:MAG: metalloregulator ArsR/SmtB family transcription factor, partial [Lentisphaerota bacterium]